MNRPKQPIRETPPGNATEKSTSCCNDSSHCGSSAFNRRELLQLGGAGLAMGALRRSLPVMAGPFEDVNEYLRLIPADKKLDADWLRSLFRRGEKDVYSDPDALSHIGMPVGGLFAGTVYLSGDGRLWLWDIFNRDQEGIAPRNVSYQGQAIRNRNGANYIEPAEVESPFRQGFVVRVNGEEASLDREGFKEITFRGEYPRAVVSYGGGKMPVGVRLEAFSPFIPLNLDDSSIPATVMRYTVKNVGSEPLEVGVFGHLQNPVCRETPSYVAGQRCNRVVRKAGFTGLECSAQASKPRSAAARADILFEDFEKETYDGWEVEGTAFGKGPVKISDIPEYQGDVGGKGARVANSHASAPGSNIQEKDSQTGVLLSDPFTISRHFITFQVGGGAHRGRTCVTLLVDGQVAATVTGKNQNRMTLAVLDVAEYEGKRARLVIRDSETVGWGNIGVDQIVFTDSPPSAAEKLERQRDFGSMTLALLGLPDGIQATASREENGPSAIGGLAARLEGEVGRTVTLAPAAEAEFTFVLAWHFPNFTARGIGEMVGHHYASRFESSLAVADYLADNYDRLAGQTQTWVETWYDSTLPYWLLDRTMANTSTLATTTCYRFEDGRFWAWEGIGCCPGTCTHVWHYAQAPGRLFPELERSQLERVSLGVGQHKDGGIGMRTDLEKSNDVADDGHCGRILGALREHQMSTDDAFLRRIWSRVRKAVAYMIRRDGNGDGILEGAQHNTLDAAWYGKISFISSLYLAALRAGQQMATEMGDEDFARECKAIADQGEKSILETFNGEFFIQIEDPRHADAIGTGPGCYIDQIFGQTWAHHVGIGSLFDRDKQLSALRALWKYNFVPDVGPFREHFKLGRWYAMAGDAGLIMCSWPGGGKREGLEANWQYMYFNECMSGFEYQAAAHMVWEGRDQADILQNGLAITRAIHDRYNAALRNPYNEIECSDHYSRAMASYGVFLAACGFAYHGPKGHIGFAPRLSPDDFKAPFTAAEGWGTFTQKQDEQLQTHAIRLAHGSLKLNQLSFSVAEGKQVKEVRVTVGSTDVSCVFEQSATQVVIRLKETAIATPESGIRVHCELD